MAPVQRKNKKYDLKFKLSVVKYAEENSGEAAARHFSVDPKRVRDWRKNKCELQRRSEEDSERARLPGGGRKKASEELELNMRDWVIGKRARQERVSRRMIREMAKQMYATVSDGREGEFTASAGWLNRFLHRNNFTGRRQTTIAQKDDGEFTEELVNFVTFSDRDRMEMDETAGWFDTVGSSAVETHGAHGVPLETRGQDRSRQGVQMPFLSPDPGLNPEISPIIQIKEEPEEEGVRPEEEQLQVAVCVKTEEVKEEPEEECVKQEEEQLQMCVPETSAVCVKTEESSLLQQREDTQGETHVHSDTEGDTEHSSDNDEDWRAPFSCSDARTETDGGNQLQIRSRSSTAQNSGPSPKTKSVPETSATVDNGDVSRTAEGTDGKKHQCSFCLKLCGSKQNLQRHIRVHTGEKPFSCSVCNKAFALTGHLTVHMRTHTGEKPYSCSICEKTFSRKTYLAAHMTTHTGETHCSCSICNKSFPAKSNLIVHMRIHTGDKPYSCSVCGKAFNVKGNLAVHMRTHSSQKQFSCPICEKTFPKQCYLSIHIKTHTEEKPYCCSVCNKEFSLKGNFIKHMSTHTGDKPQDVYLYDASSELS